MDSQAGLRDIWRRSGGMFMSFALVAAILPVLMWGMVGTDNLRLLTRADTPTPLRLWFEPAAVVTKPGQKFELVLMAEYDDKNKLIPQVKAGLRAGAGLKVEPLEVEYRQAFVGRVELGRFEVEVLEPGTQRVEVRPGSVNTTLPDVDVETAAAQITVRE